MFEVGDGLVELGLLHIVRIDLDDIAGRGKRSLVGLQYVQVLLAKEKLAGTSPEVSDAWLLHELDDRLLWIELVCFDVLGEHEASEAVGKVAEVEAEWRIELLDATELNKTFGFHLCDDMRNQKVVSKYFSYTKPYIFWIP